MELDILKFVTKPDVNQLLRDGVIGSDDPIVKECVTDIGAYHYFYDRPPVPPVPPVPPTPPMPNNQIWYTTESGNPYPLESVITILRQVGGSYNGPEILSNEWDEDKQMYVMTFDSDITVLGDVNREQMSVEGPIFTTNDQFEITCDVTKVIIPDSVTKIGSSAFGACIYLSSINIPDSVTSIGTQAFAYCNSLTSVEIPNSVTSIERLAFYMGDHESPFTYPINTFIVNGITYYTNNEENITLVLGNGSEVNLLLWEKLGSDVEVKIADVEGTIMYSVELGDDTTFAEQGYSGYYSSNTYDSDQGESPVMFLVDDCFPTDGEIIYNDIEDIGGGGTDVTVNVVDAEGTETPTILDSSMTYAEQGYDGYYSQDTYDPNAGESPEDFFVDIDYPEDGNTIYETIEPASADVTVTVVDAEGTETPVTLDSSMTYAEQGYDGYYSSNTYDPSEGEMPRDFLVDDDYPEEGDTIYETIEPDSTDVTVKIADVEGTIMYSVELDANTTFSEQGYDGYYSQQTYDPNEGETPDMFLVDDCFPTDGEIIYNDIEDIGGGGTDVTVTVVDAEGTETPVTLDSDSTYAEQGYDGYYSSNTYDPNEGESPEDYLLDSSYPGEGEIIYTYINPVEE